MKLSLFILFGSAGTVMAQDEAAPTPSPSTLRRGVWEADMPAGEYIVRLASITSISMHEYVVDAAARVTEVNIGTTGSDLVRFYYIEPNIPKPPDGIGQGVMDMAKEKAQTVTDRVGESDVVWQKVIKNYPMTTHAKTVEYRLSSKDTLNKLFESVKE